MFVCAFFGVSVWLWSCECRNERYYYRKPVKTVRWSFVSPQHTHTHTFTSSVCWLVPCCLDALIVRAFVHFLLKSTNMVCLVEKHTHVHLILYMSSSGSITDIWCISGWPEVSNGLIVLRNRSNASTLECSSKNCCLNHKSISICTIITALLLKLLTLVHILYVIASNHQTHSKRYLIAIEIWIATLCSASYWDEYVSTYLVRCAYTGLLVVLFQFWIQALLNYRCANNPNEIVCVTVKCNFSTHV